MEAPYVSSVAGFVATALFVSSHVPMLFKAFRTKDLRSYSLTNLLLLNLGDGVYWVYIATLPVGPIWFLHGFYTVVTAVMLFWYWRYRPIRGR
jgi:uncharacterized protein with PQ loop repeat